MSAENKTSSSQLPPQAQGQGQGQGQGEVDPYQLLQIRLNPDGTLTRYLPPTTPPSTTTPPLLSKDVTINHANKTWARIFLPPPPQELKLPVLVYFHGGGFILGTPDMTVFHEFLSNIALQLNVVVVSPSYRLAPEHRLPVAYDDAMEALHWVKASKDKDDWLREHADFSKCFLMGTSAGGNIAYRVGLRAAQETDRLLPLEIRGLILHQPFFGGSRRTPSELRLENDPFFPVCASDLMWELSLPVGADRDHQYCNPTVDDDGGDDACILEKIARLGWRVLVTGSGGDQLIDRQMELAKVMERKGIQVVGRFSTEGCHGFELLDSSKANALHLVLKNFMS